MRGVIGLLMLFAGAELIYLVVTGKLGNSSQGTGGGPDSLMASHVSPVHPASATGITHWGTMAIPVQSGGLLP